MGACRHPQKHIISMLWFFNLTPVLVFSKWTKQAWLRVSNTRTVYRNFKKLELPRQKTLVYTEFKNYTQPLLCDWLIFNDTSSFRINKQMFIGFSSREKKSISLVYRPEKQKTTAFTAVLEKFLAKTLNRTVLWSWVSGRRSTLECYFYAYPRAPYLFSELVFYWSVIFLEGRPRFTRSFISVNLLKWKRF